mgnify:CR=1 FL=1
MNTNEMNKSSEDKSDKNAYQSPQLTVYGNISEITRAVNETGMNDGGGGGTMDKT